MDGSRVWERMLAAAASGAWTVVQVGNRLIPGTSRQGRWAPSQKVGGAGSAPELDIPRSTTSLCPDCVREMRARIAAGELGQAELRRSQPGQIPARILERDGSIVMEKDCPRHGHFEETISVNPSFTRRIERLFPGRDFDSSGDRLHDHGPSSIRFGRGGVLTIDLTNRCDMMCNPCFMNANQVGYVHELTFEEVKRLIDSALTIRPKRQVSIQFSGGEPTLSPIFLESIA